MQGFCEGMNIASKIGLGRPVNGELVFYCSLFQAGIDRVIIGKEVPKDLRKQIPQHRFHVLPSADYWVILLSLQAYFEHYLGTAWDKKPEHKEIRLLRDFLADLLASFNLERPLVAIFGMPDIASLETTLPLEILLPVKALFRGIKAYDSAVALPTLEVSKQSLGVIEEVMASSAYRDVEEQHRALLLKPTAVKSCLVQLEKANKALYWKWKDFLRMKSSLVHVARDIPAIIEAFVGKAPSSVVKPIVDVLAEKLSKRQGLLIYDTKPILTDAMHSILYQSAKSPNSHR